MKQRCNMMHYYKLYYLNKADLLKQANIYFFTSKQTFIGKIIVLKNIVWLILGGGIHLG